MHMGEFIIGVFRDEFKKNGAGVDFNHHNEVVVARLEVVQWNFPV